MPESNRIETIQLLRELRDEFQDGSRRHPDLYHVLVQAVTDSHPMLSTVPTNYEDRFGLPIAAKPGSSPPTGGFPAWQHRYFGNASGLTEFKLKAALAARHLASLGPDALGHPAGDGEVAALPMDWTYGSLRRVYDYFTRGDEAEYWLLAMHHLGWKTRVGEVFSARRRVWAKEIWVGNDREGKYQYDYWHAAPYETEEYKRHLASYASHPPRV
jgi:hypothetical protein